MSRESGGTQVLENPFRLPPDEQIFLLREQQKKKKEEERELKKNQKVWEKKTASGRLVTSKRLRADRNDSDKSATNNLNNTTGTGVNNTQNLNKSENQRVELNQARERENTSDFVAKKREMFLVQMSLDVKKAEILKLDEKARAKETALRKSQQMLDEDVTRFDTFLQANDAKAHKAMKHAEEMTKVKQERLQKIKHLRGKIAQIQSEISKYREQKEECVKFKKFLDFLTPAEWKTKQAEIRRQTAERKKQNWLDQRQNEIESRIRAELIVYEEMIPDPLQEALKKGKKINKKEEEMLQVKSEERRQDIEMKRRKLKKKYHPGQEALEREYSEELAKHRSNHGQGSGASGEDSDEDEELYFTEPKHLLDIFTNLEEANLFLIQNAQESEEAMEEISEKFTTTRGSMEQRTKSLHDNIEGVSSMINEKKSKCEHALAEINAAKMGKGVGEDDENNLDGSSKSEKEKEDKKKKTEVTDEDNPNAIISNDSSQSTLLKQLSDQIWTVHQVCGFDTDARDPLQMLQQIEAKLEEVFVVLDNEEMSGFEGKELVQRLEREKEKERRERVRQERLELQTRKNEERLKASLLRSQAPVHKKCGKQIMFRSQPKLSEKKVVKEDADEVERERDHKVFGIYLDKQGVPHASKPIKTTTT